ncbi:22161_t:CDS:2 [Cetraspora pellucida]|uniref:22161_t:CDS:1 n=1 Tax=Cetraspora pellucida TaxID=1433469 RepID=A0A9N9AF64_9GLOM|nr:22161_t:CDS:2 [Cetraspora pellucida]
MLGRSKYVTMSYMFVAISSLKKLLNVDNNIVSVTVDFNNLNSAFSNNLDLKEKIEFANEPEIIEAKTYLVAEYKLFKESASTLYDITQIKDDKKKNALLAAMYTLSIQNSKINEKI